MEDTMDQNLRITGMVQGVCYRVSMQRKATELGVTGWVRNRSDGSVEAAVHGTKEQIDALIRWCYAGPPAASVRDIVSTVTGQIDIGDGFDIRATK